MGKLNTIEGSQLFRFFGPLLDALRGLGGSGTPDEVVERIAQDLKLPDDVQNELLPSGESLNGNVSQKTAEPSREWSIIIRFLSRMESAPGTSIAQVR